MMRNKKRVISLILATLMVFVLTGCQMSEEEEEVVYGVQALSIDQLVDDQFYIKHGDVYYEIVYGDESFGDGYQGAGQNYDIPKFKANDPLDNIERTIFYSKGRAEYNIPTMYKDDELIYKSSVAIEDNFTWERFADGGYTLGLRSLFTSDHDTIEFTNYTMNVAYEEETIRANIQTAEKNDEKDRNGNPILRTFVLDAIDGQKVTPELIGPSGYLLGLSPSKECVFDVYDGTNLIQFTDIADYRVFYGLECFWTTGLTYTDNNYAIVKMGDFFKSGYYKCNGSGMFRYVAEPYSEGMDLNSIHFNEAFFQYAVDEKGELYLDFIMNEDNTRYLYDETEIAAEKERRRIIAERERLGEYGNAASGGAVVIEQTPIPVVTPTPEEREQTEQTEQIDQIEQQAIDAEQIPQG